ncbi:MAG: LysR family transcriptional regulator [Pseudomonadota bacterium]
MDVIKSMTAFREVVRRRGFAPAARSLGLSTSSVSRQVIELEGWLGIGLLQRTTRSVSLTEEGAYYLSECQRVLRDVEQLKSTANETLSQPVGTLRLTAPVFLAKECIRRVLPEFLLAFPRIDVELFAVDRFVDLIDEGYDLALRVGDLPDSSHIARGLGQFRLIVVASPRYLASEGTPMTIGQLKDHNCIVDTVASFANRWPMKRDGKRQKIAVSGNVTVNNGEIARDLAVQGLGLTILPEFFVLDQLDSGELVEVLSGQVESSIGLFAVYPQSRHTTPRVREFIDFCAQYFDRRTHSSD